ncbi:MAG: Hsp20/alpha crystallin family protein [Actinomycetota bacterium]|jgi:HSP20 family protein|nr:Hsp20/alpha crystallin family protein [Actinomycetota bacterium]MDA8073758.1 Hsp20/alpha crystallin family protein [Actinomycetota bacterium]
MLMRFDPYRELDALTNPLRDGGRLRTMALDAYRIGDVFHVDLDMPGVDAGSIDVTVEQNVVSVKATRQWDNEAAETVICERPQGTFTRELFLGDALDAEKISATYDNGVLRLRIPVAEQAKSRRISISTASEPHAIGASTAA